MRHFVFGVVVNVLRHVSVQDFERLGIETAAAAARNFAVLDAAQFVVLLPEIGLENFGSCQKTQDGDVADGDDVIASLRFRDGGQKRSGRQGRSDDAQALEEGTSLDRPLGRRRLFGAGLIGEGGQRAGWESFGGHFFVLRSYSKVMLLGVYPRRSILVEAYLRRDRGMSPGSQRTVKVCTVANSHSDILSLW